VLDFLIEHKEWLLSGIGVTLIWLIIALARHLWTRHKRRPGLEEMKVSLPIPHPNTRICRGSFLINNTSDLPCDVTSIRLTCPITDLPEVNLVSLDGPPQRGQVRPTDQNLPIAIPSGRRRLYFLTKEVVEVYCDGLPDRVTIIVEFNKKVLISKVLERSRDHHYEWKR